MVRGNQISAPDQRHGRGKPGDGERYARVRDAVGQRHGIAAHTLGRCADLCRTGSHAGGEAVGVDGRHGRVAGRPGEHDSTHGESMLIGGQGAELLRPTRIDGGVSGQHVDGRYRRRRRRRRRRGDGQGNGCVHTTGTHRNNGRTRGQAGGYSFIFAFRVNPTHGCHTGNRTRPGENDSGHHTVVLVISDGGKLLHASRLNGGSRRGRFDRSQHRRRPVDRQGDGIAVDPLSRSADLRSADRDAAGESRAVHRRDTLIGARPGEREAAHRISTLVIAHSGELLCPAGKNRRSCRSDGNGRQYRRWRKNRQAMPARC